MPVMTDRLDEQIARIAADHHGLFARHHLLELRVTPEERRHRLATGRWESVHDSAYRIAGTPARWHASVLAACWAGGTRAVASHRSAAELYGLPGGRRDRVEITCPRWRRARHQGIVVHESLALREDVVTVVDGIPCTTVERTLFDIAGMNRPRTLDLAIDAALRQGLTSVAALRDHVQGLAKRGRRGSARFRSAIDLRTPADVVPESAPERLLATALVHQGLPRPELQYVVRDVDGAFVARVDIAYPKEKILIEYESFQEHTGKLALVRDSARRNALVALGFTALSATAADLRDDAAMLARAVRRIRDQAA
jgi:predicted transcriptional regulator of viral defense system